MEKKLEARRAERKKEDERLKLSGRKETGQNKVGTSSNFSSYLFKFFLFIGTDKAP